MATTRTIPWQAKVETPSPVEDSPAVSLVAEEETRSLSSSNRQAVVDSLAEEDSNSTSVHLVVIDLPRNFFSHLSRTDFFFLDSHLFLGSSHIHRFAPPHNTSNLPYPPPFCTYLIMLYPYTPVLQSCPSSFCRQSATHLLRINNVHEKRRKRYVTEYFESNTQLSKIQNLDILSYAGYSKRRGR